ncbi:MAG: hypothetical protein ACQES5_01225 [Thermodesulfobacteriota bacterium]
MQVKTYSGRTLSEIMPRIKAELGPQAAILSTDHRKENGKSICDVVAGVENESGSDSPTKKLENTLSGQENTEMGLNADWRQEWEIFKKTVFDLVRPGLDKSGLSAKQALGLEHLEKEGLAPELLMCIWQRLRQNSKPTLAILGEFISICDLRPNHFPKQKLMAFCGPNGVGKTTSLVRYALECKRKHKNISLCLANADGMHAAGRLFLKHYCDLSGFAYQEVSSPAQWANLPRLRKKFDMVLVDLPGMTPGIDLKKWLEQRGGAPRNMDLHMVMSPVYADVHMRNYIQKYAHPCVKSMIWTKLDEACVYGTILNTVWKTGLPLSGLGFGTGIKDSTLKVAKNDIWQLLFKHKMPSGKITGNPNE